MTTTEITLDNISLNIPVYAKSQQRLFRKSVLNSAIGGQITATKDSIIVNALSDISVNVSKGQHLGLIGPNGAGKTSLLKLIAGIFPPSSGYISTKGTIGCLIIMTLGMSEDMTGYDCIRYFLSVICESDADWKELAKDIDEFTELGDYLEMPIRTYSAGMRTRLFAALATSVRHDILLIDEGISAGDAGFHKKFEQRLHNFLGQANILVLASHNQELLSKYCTHGMVLNNGSMKFLGPIEEAIQFNIMEN